MTDGPVVNPEAEGLPSTADDDSTAFEDGQSSRIADGPDPAALPADRPIASFDYGTTPAEARTPEPLADRLDREEPEPDPFAEAAAGTVESPDPDGMLTDAPADGLTDVTGADSTETDPLDATAGVVPDPTELSDGEPLPDAAELPAESAEPGTVGRLVAPDEGAHPDLEGTSIAADSGSTAGRTAEEAALHEGP
jgi:hypothetical protein